jgi:hypothetical protein
MMQEEMNSLITNEDKIANENLFYRIFTCYDHILTLYNDYYKLKILSDRSIK